MDSNKMEGVSSKQGNTLTNALRLLARVVVRLLLTSISRLRFAFSRPRLVDWDNATFSYTLPELLIHPFVMSRRWH